MYIFYCCVEERNPVYIEISFFSRRQDEQVVSAGVH